MSWHCLSGPCHDQDFAGGEYGVGSNSQLSCVSDPCPSSVLWPYAKLGESYDTPEPPSALASARQRLFGGSAAQSIGPAFLQPSRPARCDVHRPATRIDPCPGVGGEQGIECLSDERFQLILLQARAEFPFHAFSHLLSGPSGCFHLLEHVECLCQGAVLGIYPVLVPSPKGPCHFPT